MRRLLPVFVFLLLLMPVNAAAFPIPILDDVTQAGADMVSYGINTWLIGTADSMIDTAGNVTGTNVTRSSGQMMLFNMVTYEYNPFDNPNIISTIQFTGIIFLFLFVIFVFGGLAYVMIHSKNPALGQAVDYTLFDDRGFDFKEYIRTLGMLIVFIVFGFTAVWTAMLISSVLSQMMTITALDTLVSSSSSAIVYFMMALAYLILSVFMAIRILGISIITSLLLLLFALWQFHTIRDLVNMVFVYFSILIFMQPILISIAAIGIMTIEWIAAMNLFSSTVLYLGLIIILVAAALTLLLGPALFGKLIKIGSKAIL